MPRPTQQEIADHLGLKQAQVSRLAARGMPTSSLAEAAEWRKANVQARVRAGNKSRPAAPDPYQLARTSREVSEARRSAVAALREEGALVSRETVRAEIGRRLSGLRESLLQMPARLQSVLAAETDEAKVHEILQDEVYMVLARIAEAA